MGGLCGGVRDSDDRTVTSEIETDRQKDRTVKKLLLLGAGGSGKSTLFKQMQNILGSGFTSAEKKTFKPQIYEQIIESMNIMICKCQDLVDGVSNNDDDDDENEEHDNKQNEKYRISEDNMPSAKIVLGLFI